MSKNPYTLMDFKQALVYDSFDNHDEYTYEPIPDSPNSSNSSTKIFVHGNCPTVSTMDRPFILAVDNTGSTSMVFAIDENSRMCPKCISGSRSGEYYNSQSKFCGKCGTALKIPESTVLDVERYGAEHFVRKGMKISTNLSWNIEVEKLSSITDITSSDKCTRPECIFSDQNLNDELKKASGIILFTDGKINANDVTNFATSIGQHAMHFSNIGIIVGRRMDHPKPSGVDISVLMPAMMFGEGCILFYNGRNYFILWGSGAFKSHVKNITLETVWSDIKINIEDILNTNTTQPDFDLLDKHYCYLGSGVYFHPKELLKSNMHWKELMKTEFSDPQYLRRIVEYYKMINKYKQFADWFIDQCDSFSKAKFYKKFNSIDFSKIRKSNLEPDILNALNFFNHTLEIIKEDYDRNVKHIDNYTTFNFRDDRYCYLQDSNDD